MVLNPFYEFATGFTKHPALIDPVDWVDGWPVVNGGSGPSDAKLPAPAAQEGERSRYRAKLVRPQVVGQLVDVDEFSGSGLHGDWSWAQGRVGDAAVSGGLLTWEVERSDLYVDNNTASVLVRDAPRGDYVVERYTAYTSQDGQTWVRGGAWTHSLGANARIGLVSMGATDQVTSPITAEFDDVQVFSLKGGPRR